MNRKETITMLQEVGSNLALKYGFTDMEIGEDRQKGIWGEKLTAYLEEQFGECTKEIKWRSPENPNNYVEFRFRFQDPVLALNTFDRGEVKSNLASLEYSDHDADWTHYDELRRKSWDKEDVEPYHFVDYVHTDKYRLSEMQVWGDKGLNYVKEIQDMIAEYQKEMQNKEKVSKESSTTMSREEVLKLLKEKAEWDILKNDPLTRNFSNKETDYDAYDILKKHYEEASANPSLLDSYGAVEMGTLQIGMLSFDIFDNMDHVTLLGYAGGINEGYYYAYSDYPFSRCVNLDLCYDCKELKNKSFEEFQENILNDIASQLTTEKNYHSSEITSNVDLIKKAKEYSPKRVKELMEQSQNGPIQVTLDELPVGASFDMAMHHPDSKETADTVWVDNFKVKGFEIYQKSEKEEPEEEMEL